MSKKNKSESSENPEMEELENDNLQGAAWDPAEFDESDFAKITSADRFYWVRERPNGVLNPVAGIVVAHRERVDPAKTAAGESPGFYFILELTRPTFVVDSESNEKLMQPGEQVQVDQLHQLQDAARVYYGAQSLGRCVEIVVIPRGKVKVKSDAKRTVWKIDVFAREVKGRKALPELDSIKQLNAPASE